MHFRYNFAIHLRFTVMKRCIIILFVIAAMPVFGQSARISPAAFTSLSVGFVQHTEPVPHGGQGIAATTVNPNPNVGTSNIVVQEELLAGRKSNPGLREKITSRERNTNKQPLFKKKRH